MPSVKLRHAARAIILDEDDRILLCRLAFPEPIVVWVAPGGGVEHGETPLWSLAEVTDDRGADLFSPRDLATPLAALLANGVPDSPLRLGL